MIDLDLFKIKEIFPQKSYKILFVGAEAAPFAKRGGLGDVLFSLPKALKKFGHDARVMIPRYGTIDQEKYQLKMELEGLKIATGEKPDSPYLICNVKKYQGDGTATTYFLENMEYFEKRANIYGYSDDVVRWGLLCKGTLEFLKKSEWVPDIIICADWHTGLLPNYLKTVYKDDPILAGISSIFSIHNINYQGMSDFRFIKEEEKDYGQQMIPDFFSPKLLKINWMRRGIMYADLITTVSPTYAQEILTHKCGEGLDELLKTKSGRLYGILNGLDYNFFNPEKDPYIPVNFNSHTIEKRKENKLHLQRHFVLPQNPDIFTIGIVSRLIEQKGFDLVMKMMEKLMENINFQFIILGDGDTRYKSFFQDMAKKYPDRVGCNLSFDAVLPHLVFAGVDVVLVPSRFEPCGLTQLQAMRYGAIPIVRKTGGLADTVNDFDPNTRQGNGFVFDNYDPYALFAAIVRAKMVYKQKIIWNQLTKRIMEEDFSWKKSAKEYCKLLSIAVRYRNLKTF
ncbi:glycogen synthase [Candidatus Parcubacteria bacterium]|nr:glycogen synthase [Candidatus Parcubacteria bacterium]